MQGRRFVRLGQSIGGQAFVHAQRLAPQSFVLTKRIDAPALVFSQFTAYPLQTQNKNSDVGYKQFAFLGPVKQIESNPIISNKR